MQSTTTTDTKPGDAVRFAYPNTGAEFFGTCEGHTVHQGKPAMLIRVAGFPAWIHTAPLDLVEPAPNVPTLYQTAKRFFSGAGSVCGATCKGFVCACTGCTGNCDQGRNCTCQHEADTVPGAL
jgi:hypothetical protein